MFGISDKSLVSDVSEDKASSNTQAAKRESPSEMPTDTSFPEHDAAWSVDKTTSGQSSNASRLSVRTMLRLAVRSAALAIDATGV